MSAPKQLHSNPALQHAANLNRGVFRRAAQQPDPPAPLARPATLQTPRYPFPDNFTVISYDMKTSFMIQREGLSFYLCHEPGKKIFSVKQMNDPVRKTFDSRQLTREEAEYVLQLVKDHLGPAECAVYQGPLDALAAALPDTVYRDSPVHYSAGKREYSFNKYACSYRVSAVPPYTCDVTYKDGDDGIFRTRTMRSEEIARARGIIVATMSLDESIQQQGFLQGLQEVQYSSAPSPATP